MKKLKDNVCPGCSRHCTADAVRCKRGRIYFEKQAERISKKLSATSQKKYKWEKYVAQDDVLWKLLHLSTAIKKRLKLGNLSEAQLMSVLTEEERAALTTVIDKLDGLIKKCTNSV